MLDGRALRQRWPWLSDKVTAGCFCPNDGHANPRLVGPAFARAARAAGAEVREGEEAVVIEREGAGFRVTTRTGLEVRARVLVNAAGAWGAAIAARFGEPVPMHAIAPQMIVTEPAPYRIEPVLGIVGGAIYLRQIERGNVIFGGGDGIADTARTRSYVLPCATISAASVAHALIPHLRHLNIIRVWTGIEGETEDFIPVLGASRTTPGLFHAFGFSGHGFQLGPVVGLVLSELILDGATPSPIAPFDVGRFASAPA
jgi:sarcosine oxidase subunit beta